MLKVACILLGFAFLSLCVSVGMVAKFNPDQIYVNMGELILGTMGLGIGMFSRK